MSRQNKRITKKKKLRKPYKASPFSLRLCLFIGLFAPGILVKCSCLDFVNCLSVSNFPKLLDFVSLYFAKDLFLILFLRYCNFIFSFFSSDLVFYFDSKKQLELLHIWLICKDRHFLQINLKNTKLKQKIVKVE